MRLDQQHVALLPARVGVAGVRREYTIFFRQLAVLRARRARTRTVDNWVFRADGVEEGFGVVGG